MAKKITKIIQARVEEALSDFSKDISDKKFKKNLRKAGKILKDGLDLPKDTPIPKEKV
jgi:hypothetical protein